MQVDLSGRHPAQVAALIAFFRARKGRAHGFRFKDWTDYQAFAQILGTGYSTTRAFQLVRHYASGAAIETRTITKPVPGSVTLYRDCAEVTSGWSVDTATELVTLRTTGTPVSFALTITNGSFEADGAGDGSGFTHSGWTRVSGDWDVHDAGNGGLAPAQGSFYLEGGSSAAGELIQSVDLVGAGLDPGQIDADAYRLDASASRANSFPDDLGRVVLEAFDGADSLLVTLLDTGFEAILPEDSWAEWSVDQAPLPAGTRVLRIRLLHQRAARSQSNAAFDAVTAIITDRSRCRAG